MTVPNTRKSVSAPEAKHRTNLMYDKSGRPIVGFFTEEHTITAPNGAMQTVEVVHPVTIPRQTEGTEPAPPVKPAPGVKPPTKTELEEHPFVLRGDEKTVEKYQPIVDSKFEDLTHHPVTERAVMIEEGGTEKGVGGFYRSRFLDAKTGQPHMGGLTLPELESGKVVVRPDKIVIGKGKYSNSADRDQAFVHEISHMRRAVQEDAKLNATIADTDLEEKENVLETYARLGVAQTANTRDANYYGYYLRKHMDDTPPPHYPQVALDDQETIGTYSPGGVSNTPRIEEAIIKNKGKTKLGSVRIARHSPYGLEGRRHAPGGGKTFEASVVTNNGYYYHFYSPDGTLTKQAIARTIEQDGPKVQKAYALEGKSKERVV